MKKFLLWLPAMAIFAGCANQDLTNVTDATDKSQTEVLNAEKASLQVGGELGDGTSLRTTLSLPDISQLKQNTIYWAPGDQIGLYALATNGFAGAYNSANNYGFLYDGTPPETVTNGSFERIQGYGNSNMVYPLDYVPYYPFITSKFRQMYIDGSGKNLTFNLMSQIDDGISGHYSNFGIGAMMYGVNLFSLDQATAAAMNTAGSKWSKANQSQKIVFKHATAVIVFDIKGIPPTETLYQIIVKSVNPNILKRSFLLTPSSTMILDGYTPEIKLFTGGMNGATTNGEYLGVLSVSPGMAGEKFVVNVLTNKHCYTGMTFTAPGGGLLEGYVYSVTRTLDPGNYLPAGRGTSPAVWDGSYLSYSVPSIVMTGFNPSPYGNIIIRTPSELKWVANVFNHQISTYDWGGLQTNASNAGNSVMQGCTIYIQNDIDMGSNTWSSLTATNTGFKGTFTGPGKIYDNTSGTTAPFTPVTP